MLSVSATFQMHSNRLKYRVRYRDREKVDWPCRTTCRGKHLIPGANTSIKYHEFINFQDLHGSLLPGPLVSSPWSPGPLFLSTHYAYFEVVLDGL